MFRRLASVYAQPPPRPRNSHSRSAGADGGGTSVVEVVEVVEVTRVAGLNATVLRASDPNALAGWLREHGFCRALKSPGPTSRRGLPDTPRCRRT